MGVTPSLYIPFQDPNLILNVKWSCLITALIMMRKTFPEYRSQLPSVCLANDMGSIADDM